MKEPPKKEGNESSNEGRRNGRKMALLEKSKKAFTLCHTVRRVATAAECLKDRIEASYEDYFNLKIVKIKI